MEAATGDACRVSYAWVTAQLLLALADLLRSILGWLCDLGWRASAASTAATSTGSS